MYNATFLQSADQLNDFRTALLWEIPKYFEKNNYAANERLIVLPLVFFQMFAKEYNGRLDLLVKAAGRDGEKIDGSPYLSAREASMPLAVVRYKKLLNAMQDAAPTGTIHLTATGGWDASDKNFVARGSIIILSVGPDFPFMMTSIEGRTTLHIGALTLVVAETPAQITEAINASRKRGYAQGLWPVPPVKYYNYGNYHP